MKSNVILVSLIAILITVSAVNLASATGNLNVGTPSVSIKGIQMVTTQTVESDAGETIPIEVVFTAGENASDARVKAYIEGYRSDISANTERFEVLSGTTYSKLLSLKVPSDVDPAEDYTLYVRVGTKTEYDEVSFKLSIQRKSYNLGMLNVDVARSVTAGSTLPVNVVIKNAGSRSLDDNFVAVRITALGIEKKAYFSDLTPTDVCDDCNKQDAAERTLYISIPSDAKPGVYTLEVEAFNSDAEVKTTKTIAIVGNEQKSDVLVPTISKDVSVGGTVSYDLIIVNSGDRIASYDIVPENAQNLIVSVDQPIVAVQAGSSQTVKVNVQAGNVMGTFNFAVDVNSQGQPVEKVNLAANVGKAGVASNNIVILTVVLAVIFVVLLIVLIVLLTRKPEKTEEFGESYY